MLTFGEYISEKKLKYHGGSLDLDTGTITKYKKVKPVPFIDFLHLVDDISMNFIDSHCFENAFKVCFEVSNASYVFGLWKVNGEYIIHAWNLIGGKHVDFTPNSHGDPDEVLGDYYVVRTFTNSEAKQQYKLFSKEGEKWVSSFFHK